MSKTLYKIVNNEYAFNKIIVKCGNLLNNTYNKKISKSIFSVEENSIYKCEYSETDLSVNLKHINEKYNFKNNHTSIVLNIKNENVNFYIDLYLDVFSRNFVLDDKIKNDSLVFIPTKFVNQNIDGYNCLAESSKNVIINEYNYIETFNDETKYFIKFYNEFSKYFVEVSFIKCYLLDDGINVDEICYLNDNTDYKFVINYELDKNAKYVDMFCAQDISDYNVKYLSKNVKSIISPIVNTDDIFYYLGFNIKNNTESNLYPVKSFIFKIDFDKYNIEKFNQLKNYIFDKVSILTYNDLTSKFSENEKYDNLLPKYWFYNNCVNSALANIYRISTIDNIDINIINDYFMDITHDKSTITPAEFFPRYDDGKTYGVPSDIKINYNHKTKEWIGYVLWYFNNLFLKTICECKNDNDDSEIFNIINIYNLQLKAFKYNIELNNIYNLHLQLKSIKDNDEKISYISLPNIYASVGNIDIAHMDGAVGAGINKTKICYFDYINYFKNHKDEILNIWIKRKKLYETLLDLVNKDFDENNLYDNAISLVKYFYGETWTYESLEIVELLKKEYNKYIKNPTEESLTNWYKNSFNLIFPYEYDEYILENIIDLFKNYGIYKTIKKPNLNEKYKINKSGKLEKVNDNDTDDYEIEKYNNFYRAIYNHLATFKYRYTITGKETDDLTEEDIKNGVSKYKLEICNKIDDKYTPIDELEETKGSYLIKIPVYEDENGNEKKNSDLTFFHIKKGKLFEVSEENAYDENIFFTKQEINNKNDEKIAYFVMNVSKYTSLAVLSEYKIEDYYLSSNKKYLYSYNNINVLTPIKLQIYLLNIFINELEKTFDIIEFIKNYIKIEQFNQKEFVHNESIICDVPTELSYPSVFTKIFNTDMFTAKDTNQYLKLENYSGGGSGEDKAVCLYNSNGSYISYLNSKKLISSYVNMNLISDNDNLNSSITFNSVKSFSNFITPTTNNVDFEISYTINDISNITLVNIDLPENISYDVSINFEKHEIGNLTYLDTSSTKSGYFSGEYEHMYDDVTGYYFNYYPDIVIKKNFCETTTKISKSVNIGDKSINIIVDLLPSSNAFNAIKPNIEIKKYSSLFDDQNNNYLHDSYEYVWISPTKLTNFYEKTEYPEFTSKDLLTSFIDIHPNCYTYDDKVNGYCKMTSSYINTKFIEVNNCSYIMSGLGMTEYSYVDMSKITEEELSKNTCAYFDTEHDGIQIIHSINDIIDRPELIRRWFTIKNYVNNLTFEPFGIWGFNANNNEQIKWSNEYSDIQYIDNVTTFRDTLEYKDKTYGYENTEYNKYLSSYTKNYVPSEWQFLSNKYCKLDFYVGSTFEWQLISDNIVPISYALTTIGGQPLYDGLANTNYPENKWFWSSSEENKEMGWPIFLGLSSLRNETKFWGNYLRPFFRINESKKCQHDDIFINLNLINLDKFEEKKFIKNRSNTRQIISNTQQIILNKKFPTNYQYKNVIWYSLILNTTNTDDKLSITYEEFIKNNANKSFLHKNLNGRIEDRTDDDSKNLTGYLIKITDIKDIFEYDEFAQFKISFSDNVFNQISNVTLAEFSDNKKDKVIQYRKEAIYYNELNDCDNEVVRLWINTSSSHQYGSLIDKIQNYLVVDKYIIYIAENKPYIILHEDASLLQDNMLILVGPDDSYEIPKTISINKFMETDEDTLSNITLINCLVSNVFNWHLNEVVNEKEHNFMLCNCDRYPENLCYIFNYNGIDFKGNFDPILYSVNNIDRPKPTENYNLIEFNKNIDLQFSYLYNVSVSKKFIINNAIINPTDDTIIDK